MRIRRSAAHTVSACSSSSSFADSTISTNSIASSSSSTSSILFNSFSPSSKIRCQGLDLLVKAVYYVAGSAVAVPYIQRRVIRRRKRAVRFQLFRVENEEEEGERADGDRERKRRRRRTMSFPSKYQDSVLLHQWKPRIRGRRSSKI